MEALDKKSIDTFFNVSDANAVSRPSEGSMTDRMRAATANALEDISLVLRSRGAIFPSPCPKNYSRPPFVVGLAHHRPTDVFLIFAFTPQTMPCRMARFDRYGSAVEHTEISEEICDTKWFKWSETDAAVLVAAMDKCQQVGYFDTSPAGAAPGTSKISTTEIESTGEECPADRENYLRLVQPGEAKLEDAKALRSVIMSELLPSSGDGLDFRHPDPNFLLRLSNSILDELSRWRDLVSAVPPAANWPELPLPVASKEKTDDGQQMTDVEEKDFVRITEGRKDQLEREFSLCQRALTKMESLILDAQASIEGGNKGQFCLGMQHGLRIGKEGIASIAALEQLQGRHVESWREFDDAIEEVCNCMDMGDNSDGYGILKPWLENEAETPQNPSSDTNGDHCEGIGSDCEQEGASMSSADENGADILAKELVGSWVKEDQAMLDTLSNAVSLLHESITAPDCLQANRAGIRSAEGDILRLKEKAERSTAAIAIKLVKLWNEPISDDESSDSKEPWIRPTLWPQWDEDAVEAHLSFGWRVSDREDHSTMSFTVDHVGFVQSLKGCIEDLLSEDEESYSGRTDMYKSCWERIAKPAIDEALGSADQFFKSGDLRNASILIICCSYVLCDKNLAGNAVGPYSDEDYSYHLENVFVARSEKAMRELDILSIRTSMAFFDEESTLIRAGAHWLFDLMRSGKLYFPTSIGAIEWKDTDSYGCASRGYRQPHWRNYSHPAAAIFSHHGWRHPILCSAIKGDNESANKWSDMEAPEVVKERHNFMKERGKMAEAIALAKMARGDIYALRYLLQCGLSNDAIEQASASGNMKGLAPLSEDLMSTDPFASLLCMQAHVLGRVEENMQLHFITLATAIKFFCKKWRCSLVAVENNDHPCTPVLPMRFFCKRSLTRTFLLAAKFTHEMQSILEAEQNQQTDMSLDTTIVMSVLAIVTQATPQDAEPHNLDGPIQYFLSQTGLLSTGSNGHSGVLTEFGHYPSSFGREGFLDLCCTLCEIARFLIEKQCTSAFCFNLALFSSVQVTFLSGSQIWSLNFIDTLPEEFKDIDKSLDSLALCYARLFSSNCPRYPLLFKALLGSFLKVRPIKCGSEPWWSEQCRFWAAIAYMQECSPCEAACALVHNILLGQPTDQGTYDYEKFEKMVMRILRQLSSIHKMDSESSEDYPMTPYVMCPHRRGVTELERDQMLSSCIERLFQSSFSFSSSAIAELIDLHVTASPLFWSHEPNGIDGRLANVTGLVEALSKKKSLLQASKVMIYVDKSLRDGEIWCGRHIILEIGLGWLRNALCSSQTSVIQFDNREALDQWNTPGFTENYTAYFERYQHSWDYSRTYFSRDSDLSFDNAPKLAAKTLIAVLQASILLVEDEMPHLAKCCTEAKALCSVLDFIILPTHQRLDKVTASQNALGLFLDRFPLHLRPERLLTLILDPQWSNNPDFPVCNHSYERMQYFIVPRIRTALSQSQIRGSVSLCLESSSGSFWSDLSDRSLNGGGETMRRAREILQGCLLILKAAIIEQEELPADFVNITMHLMMSLNWLPACRKCCPDLQVCQAFLDNTPVSYRNVSALHETALSWSEFLDRNGKDRDHFTAPLVHCLNVVRCLSQCIQICTENNCLYQCKECGFKDDGNYKSGTDELEGGKPAQSARDKRAMSRKKRKLQCAGSRDIESYFHELLTYISQLHLKEAGELCKNALRRISSKHKNEKTSKQARISTVLKK